jgi:uncharacterized protein (DUF1697 family)
MARYAGFLRAINVGGHTVKMDALRGHIESLGFGGVETFIASGNVVFDSAKRSASAIEETIEDGLRDALGYEVATFVRTIPELEEIAGREPFGDGHRDEGSEFYITLTRTEPSAGAVERLRAHESGVDTFAIVGREVYWRCRKSISTSEFSGAKLEKALGAPATMRNVKTLRRMAAKYGGGT